MLNSQFQICPAPRFLPNCLHRMKELKLSLDGAPLTVLLGDKVTKEDLYGEVRSVVEKDGRPLERGYLLPDGTLVRKAQMSSASIDGEGSPIEAAQSFVDDQLLEMQPSSFEK